MISKVIGLPYHKYTGDALRLINQSAMTVDEVIVGHKDTPNLIRKITTFRDSNGHIFERAINFSDKPFKNRIYETNDYVIGENEFVTSTHIKEYNLPRKLKQIYQQNINKGFKKTIFWFPIKFFTNHFSENIETGEKILTQVLQTNLHKPQKEIHTFIEFPHIKNGRISNNKKILKFSVNTHESNKINHKYRFEKNVNMPKKDSFLGFRALSINDSKIAFTNKFLKDLGLRNKISIETEYLPADTGEEMTKALFDPNDGSINFIKTYKYKSKTEVAVTSRHESEHGWQFYLHAINTKGGTTDWEEMMYETRKYLPKTLRKEAQEYTESIENYVPIYQDVKRYRKNFIERKAKEAENIIKSLYDKERAEIQKEFPHIPPELL